MKLESWLALIAILISVVAVFLSARLTYAYAKRQFEYEIKREQMHRKVSALGAAISVGEQLGSLILTETSMKLGIPSAGAVSKEEEDLFKRNSGEIYAAVAKWPIAPELEKRLDALIECGILEEFRDDRGSYDKLISLYWQLRAEHIADADKVRVSHVILPGSEGLLSTLKTMRERLTKEMAM